MEEAYPTENLSQIQSSTNPHDICHRNRKPVLEFTRKNKGSKLANAILNKKKRIILGLIACLVLSYTTDPRKWKLSLFMYTVWYFYQTIVKTLYSIISFLLLTSKRYYWQIIQIFYRLNCIYYFYSWVKLVLLFVFLL